MAAILLGGGPISAALHEQVQQLAAPVYHTYGMTETATHIALRRLNGPAATDAFAPLPGVELALDERGCLAIRGPVTGGEWVQTNDLVELRADSSFVWLGRFDNVINSGGVKVHSEQVESAIEALQAGHPDQPWAARRFAITGLPDERLGEVVTLALEGAPLPAEQEAALTAALRASLDRFETPRRIVYLPHLPQTPTGKIDRAGVLAALSG
jgi:O-succinylbenzoic acid--CoA ligase